MGVRLPDPWCSVDQPPGEMTEPELDSIFSLSLSLSHSWVVLDQMEGRREARQRR